MSCPQDGKEVEASYINLVHLINGKKFFCSVITGSIYTFISQDIADAADYQTLALRADCLHLKRNVNKRDWCHLKLNSDSGLIDVF